MFRTFDLTLRVFLREGAPLPDTFTEWMELAGFHPGGAAPTILERIVETRYPLTDDVIEKRESDYRWNPWN